MVRHDDEMPWLAASSVDVLLVCSPVGGWAATQAPPATCCTSLIACKCASWVAGAMIIAFRGTEAFNLLNWCAVLRRHTANSGSSMPNDRHSGSNCISLSLMLAAL
jgi:hypothetical protein